MTIESVSPETLAKLFHHYSQALAQDFGSRSKPTPEWSGLPQSERNCMVAAARLALLDLRAPEDLCGLNSPQFAWFSGGTEGKECGC
jgi:hypothetical protein